MPPVKREQNERGQATTEYVMLIFVLAAIIISVGLSFRNKLLKLLQGRVGSAVQINGSHTFKMNIPK